MNVSVTVRQLNLYIKSLLEGDARLSDITVTGEISNFKNHFSSGHWYFTLKDGEAAIRCVMFRSFASRVKIQVADGMKVSVRGRISVYERDGQYQLYAEQISEFGVGDLAAQFEETKRRLEAEGLFNPEEKRPLPAFPKRVAVITSETGAAVQDILQISARRYPLCEILLCGVSVQGVRAVPEMIAALEKVYRLGNSDVILIGRGGGSAEDLAAYNDEALARKIYESPVPVVSAVGHETDFSICDFVADLRAPTPSAAAELIMPDAQKIAQTIEKQQLVLKRALENRCDVAKARLSALMNASVLKRPEEMVTKRAVLLDQCSDALLLAQQKLIQLFETRFSKELSRLDAMSPLKVLNRGYAVVQKGEQTVKSVGQVSEQEELTLRLQDGSVDCTVKSVRPSH